MATTTFSAGLSTATDADFRTWGLGMSTALAAIGFVKTSDTGQVDWATVTRPTVSTVWQGYEIWRFNDALQATTPIFMKIEYGSSSSGPAIRVQCGKGSNGTGTLTSAIMPSPWIAQTSNGSTLAAAPWFLSSGDGSMLTICPAANTLLTAAFNLVVERSRNPAGAATATGLLTLTKQGATTVSTGAFNYAAMTGMSMNGWPAAVPAGTNTACSVMGTSTKAPMFPAVVSDGAGNYWQPRSILSYASLDVSPLATISVEGWNTYLALGPSGQYLGAYGQYAYGAVGWW